MTLKPQRNKTGKEKREEKGMSENKQYENEYKVQAVKLAKKIGAEKAANELQIPVNTLYGWIRTTAVHRK